jgi:hypothetical protein
MLLQHRAICSVALNEMTAHAALPRLGAAYSLVPLEIFLVRYGGSHRVQPGIALRMLGCVVALFYHHLSYEQDQTFACAIPLRSPDTAVTNVLPVPLRR